MTDQPISDSGSASEADLSEIAPHFHQLAREMGVDLFRFIYASNVFQHGVNELARAGGHVTELLVHLRIMGDMYNLLAGMLTRDRGWTQEQIEAASLGAEEVMRGKIIVARAGDRRLLDS